MMIRRGNILRSSVWRFTEIGKENFPMQRLNDITKTSRRGEEKYFYRKEEEKENFRRKIRVIIAMLRRRTGGGSGITSRSCTSWLRQTSEDRVFPPREIIILDGSESGKICRVYSLLHRRFQRILFFSISLSQLFDFLTTTQCNFEFQINSLSIVKIESNFFFFKKI